MGKYFDEMKRTMTWLGSQPETYFIGQAVAFDGTAMSNTIKDVNINKRLELPVFEETQMGMTLGLAIGGFIPVSIFPRWNFLMLGTNQLVNHIDKIKDLGFNHTNGCIIRVGVGSERPLHPQHQHVGDFTDSFKLMTKTCVVDRIKEPEEIFASYVQAYESAKIGITSIMVEWGDFYNEK